ncbi:hypothetical protein C8J57DRAFT_1424760 [Mycena rebaudengoi]|nr:hypothetical protein C8J57DRAFT_1424760 [Mycena rebaudengoi]
MRTLAMSFLRALLLLTRHGTTVRSNRWYSESSLAAVRLRKTAARRPNGSLAAFRTSLPRTSAPGSRPRLPLRWRPTAGGPTYRTTYRTRRRAREVTAKGLAEVLGTEWIIRWRAELVASRQAGGRAGT